MAPATDASGHEGTPEHGLLDDAEDVDAEPEGSYVDSQAEGEDEPMHHEPEEDGTYVEVSHEKGKPPVDPHPEPGHYVDSDEESDDA
ncbi:MAG TPA: hypothetical protein VJ978_13215 [Nitriliruptoraceae bacterium]|nr:hypothetical protein [Nitriliruptoraceae bacterium]